MRRTTATESSTDAPGYTFEVRCLSALRGQDPFLGDDLEKRRIGGQLSPANHCQSSRLAVLEAQ